MEQLAAAFDLPPAEIAGGVLRVANATMERALRRVSVEQGYDPRRFTLVPFGGAGPLHACDLADALGIPRILLVPMPGVLSAYGMLVADISSDAALGGYETWGGYGASKAALDLISLTLANELRSAGVPQPAVISAQGPTGMRLVIELMEELVILGGGYGLFTGCAAGDTAAALVLEVVSS